MNNDKLRFVSKSYLSFILLFLISINYVNSATGGHECIQILANPTTGKDVEITGGNSGAYLTGYYTVWFTNICSDYAFVGTLYINVMNIRLDGTLVDTSTIFWSDQLISASPTHNLSVLVPSSNSYGVGTIVIQSTGTITDTWCLMPAGAQYKVTARFEINTALDETYLSCDHVEIGNAPVSCTVGEYLYDGSCQTSCPVNTITNSDTLICFVCQEPFPKIGENKTCVASCTTGTYDSTTNSCLTSVSCTTGEVNYENTCISPPCPGLYFYDTDDVCYICPGSLDKFVVNNSCETSCASNQIEDLTNARCIDCGSDVIENEVCVASCSTGKTANATTKRCETCASVIYTDQCISSCPIMTYESSGYCIDCAGTDNYVYNNVCLVSCDADQIPDDINKTCIDCGTDVIENEVCVASCTAGKTSNATTKRCETCATVIYNNQCISSCPIMTYESSGYCIDCAGTDNYVFNNVCLVSCDDDKIPDNTNKTCIDCGTDVIENEVCVASCTTGKTANATTKRCETCATVIYTDQCYVSCPQLTYESSGYCIDCAGTDNYVYNNICLVSCDVDQIPDDTNKTCIDCGGDVIENEVCVASCTTGKTANSTTKRCETCATVIYNNQCISSCPIMTYESSGYCIDCAGTDNYVYNNVCLVSCDDDKIPDDINKTCIDCGTDVIENEVCVASCTAGKTSNATTKRCETCATVIYNNQCYVLCPQLTYESSGYCIDCAGTDNYVYNNVCLVSCDVDQIPDDTNKTCIDCGGDVIENEVCVASCTTGKTANSTTKRCETCATVIYNNQCISSCPIMTYESSGYCIDCAGTDNYVYNNVCLVSCDDDKIPDNTNKTCIDCGTDVIENEVCVASCTAGKIVNSSTKRCEICTDLIYNNQCYFSCPQLTYESSGNCIDCDIFDNYVYNNVCLVSCDVDKIPDDTNKTCIDCGSDVIENDVCVSNCSTGKVPSATTKRCEICSNVIYNNQCIANCPLLTYNNNNYCIDCNVNENYVYNNTCYETCPVNMINDLSNNTCIDCGSLVIENEVCTAVCSSGKILNSTTNRCVVCSDIIFNNTCITECPVNYILKLGECVFCDEYIYDNQCVSSCPSLHYFDNNSLCIECGGSYKYISNNACVNVCNTNQLTDETNKICVDCEYAIENNQCVSSCSAGKTKNNTTKQCEIINNSGPSSCPNDDQVIINKKCIYCKDINKLKENDACVDNCSLGKFENNGVCIDSCTNNTYKENNTCVESCSFGYVLNSDIKECLLCDNYYQDGKCIEKCRLKYAAVSGYNNSSFNKDYICVNCRESDLIYILNSECVEECPENYTATIKNADKYCEYSLYEESDVLECDDKYCNYNGICSVTNTSELKCKCNEGFYGSQCQYTKDQAISINVEIQSRINQITTEYYSLNYDYDEIQDELNYIKSLIEEVPDMLTDEKYNELYKLTYDILDDMSTGVENTNDMIYELFDTTMVYSKYIQNYTGRDDLKDLFSQVSAKHILGLDINDYITTHNSTIYYSGEAITVQLTNNSAQGISEAYENNLAIVEANSCIELLKEQKIIPEDEIVYFLSNNYDASIMYEESDVNSTAVSQGVQVKLVDSTGNEIDTSACNDFLVKVPTPSLINLTDYQSISSEYDADIYNSKDPFLNNKCTLYSIGGADITVTLRRQLYDVEATCEEEGCSYTGIDEHNYIQCNCTELPSKSYTDFKETIWTTVVDSNFKLVTCFLVVFKSDIINNIGFWAQNIITLLTIVGITAYYAKYNNTLDAIKQNITEIIYNDATFTGITQLAQAAKVGQGKYENINKSSINTFNAIINTTNGLANINTIDINFDSNKLNMDSNNTSKMNQFKNICLTKESSNTVNKLVDNYNFNEATPNDTHILSPLPQSKGNNKYQKMKISINKIHDYYTKNNKQENTNYASSNNEKAKMIGNIEKAKNINISRPSHKENNNRDSTKDGLLQFTNSTHRIFTDKNQDKVKFNLTNSNSQKNNFFFSNNTDADIISINNNTNNKEHKIQDSPYNSSQVSRITKQVKFQSRKSSFQIDLRESKYNNTEFNSVYKDTISNRDFSENLFIKYFKFNKLTIDTQYNNDNKSNSSSLKIETDINNIKHHSIKISNSNKGIRSINNKPNDIIDSKKRLNTCNYFYNKNNHILDNDENLKEEDLKIHSYLEVENKNIYEDVLDSSKEINNKNYNNYNDIYSNISIFPKLNTKTNNSFFVKNSIIDETIESDSLYNNIPIKVGDQNNHIEGNNNEFNNISNDIINSSVHNNSLNFNQDKNKINRESIIVSPYKSNNIVAHDEMNELKNIDNPPPNNPRKSTFEQPTSFQTPLPNNIHNNYLDKITDQAKFALNSKLSSHISKYTTKKNSNNDIQRESSYNSNYNIQNDISNYNNNINSNIKVLDNSSVYNNIKIKDMEQQDNVTTKRLNNMTKNDFHLLPITKQLALSNESFCRFFINDLKYNHTVLKIFYLKSVVVPFINIFITQMLNISIVFAMNAIFYTDDYIDNLANKKSEEKVIAILYYFYNDLLKSVYSSVITIVVCTVISLIVKIPKKHMIKLNLCLIEEKEDLVMDGIKEFNKNMRCRYIIWIVSVIIVHIFCWWMVLAFCAVYVNTNNGWLFGAIISIIIDFLAFQISLSFIYAVLRHFAKKENSSLCVIWTYDKYHKLLKLIR